MRELKAQLCARWDEMLLILGLEAGFFIIAEIFMAVLVHFQQTDNSVFHIGTVTALVVAVFVVVFMGIGILPVHFNLAVSMGSARKRFMPVFLLLSFLENLAAAAAAYLLSLLETQILRSAYAGIKLESRTEDFFRWKYILAACLGLAALNAFMGMLFIKLGKIAWTIIWVLWMVCCFGIPRIGHIAETAKGTVFGEICGAVIRAVSGLTEGGILAGIVIVSAGMLAVAWGMLRKQEVRI